MINKIKKKNKYINKVFKIFLVTLTMLTTFILPNVNVKAMDNANVVTEGVSSWRMSSTDNSAWGQGMRIRIAGKVAYCVEPGVDLRYGENYISSLDPMSVGITPELADKLSLIAYYGYGYKAQTHPDWEAITQGMIWHAMGDNRYFLTDTTPNYTVLQSYWAIIQSHIDNHFIRPSFHGSEYELNVGESITITDTNNVLSDFNILSDGGLNITKSGNQLTIVATSLSDDSAHVNLRKTNTQNSILGTDTTIYWYNPIWQNTSTFGTRDPVTTNISIKVNHNGELIPNKIDNETGAIAQGDATLQGAEYGLYATETTAYYTANQLVTTFVTGEKGTVGTIGDLPLIKYYIKELSSSEGYLLDDTRYDFDLANAPIDAATGLRTLNLPLLQQVIKGRIQIFKTGHDGSLGLISGLSNAEFTFKLHSDVLNVGWDNARVYDLITTNNLGFATTIDLPYGVYQVRETKIPENHYGAEDFLVRITEDEEIIFKAVNNQPFKSWLKIIKTDILGNVVTLNNAAFKLLDEDGETVSFRFGTEIIDTFTTNEDGYVLIPGMLSYGTYTVVELNAPSGMMKGENITVIIGMNNPDLTVDENNEPLIEIKIKNDMPEGKIIINKTFEELELEEELDLFATFKITAVEDIINPVDGSIIYNAGEQIINPDRVDGLFETDEELKVIIDKLPMGLGNTSYLVEEVETTRNYSLIEPFVVDLTQTDNTTKHYLFEIDVENKITTTQIQILKHDSIDKTKVLKQAEFTLYDVNMEVLEVLETNEEGIAIFTDIRYGTYFLKETAAPLGYKLSEEIIEVIIDDNYDESNIYKVSVQNTLLPSTGVKTGDSSNAFLFIALTTITGVFAYYIINKKKQIKDEEISILE